jgi:hypothetical protein
MFETIITILIFVAVIAITALLFGGWVVVMILRGLSRLVTGALQAPEEPAMLIDASADTARCANERCRAANPAVASFCRRCGSPMRAVQRVPVRRVAMW